VRSREKKQHKGRKAAVGWRDLLLISCTYSCVREIAAHHNLNSAQSVVLLDCIHLLHECYLKL
jgi:hypothetical protein